VEDGAGRVCRSTKEVEDSPPFQNLLELIHQTLLKAVVRRMVLERDDERKTRRRLFHSSNDGVENGSERETRGQSEAVGD